MLAHDGMMALKRERLNTCKNEQAVQEERIICFLLLSPRLKDIKKGLAAMRG
jgi:hypothetical protein